MFPAYGTQRGDSWWSFPHEFMPEKSDDLAGTRDLRLATFGFETAYESLYGSDFGGDKLTGFATARSIAMTFGASSGADAALDWFKEQIGNYQRSEVPWSFTYIPPDQFGTPKATTGAGLGERSWGWHSTSGEESVLVYGWRVGRIVLIVGAYGGPEVTPQAVLDIASKVDARATE